jgi:ABC-type nitrate/sulfonate/bicarbonate transport system permease component
VLPASLPPIFTGLRLALNLAVMLTIAGELVVASSGLGHVMWFSWQTMRVADVYAWLVVIGAVGVTLNAVVSALARRAIPWAPQRPELLR